MASHHQQATDPQIGRVRSVDSQQVTCGSSRSSSRRSSFSSSNRGSVYSEESVDVLQELLEPSAGRDSVERELQQEEDGVETVARVCNSCKEEIQVQQALSVQQARQR